MGFDKALCQKEIESIKCEVTKFDLLEQVLNFKSGKGFVCTASCGSTVSPCPTQGKHH
jgi:hypothetical protein